MLPALTDLRCLIILQPRIETVRDRPRPRIGSELASGQICQVVQATGCTGSTDEATDQFVVEIVNANNEVIRQIPQEEALRLDVLFKKITGIIFDQTA